MLTTRIGAVAASIALASMITVGGATVATAQSQDAGSLGAPPAFDVVLDRADAHTVSGMLTNNTEEDLSCVITVSTERVVMKFEKYYETTGMLPGPNAEEWDYYDASESAGQTWVSPEFSAADSTRSWVGKQSMTVGAPAADYDAGVFVQCRTLPGVPVGMAFAYEIGEPFGSLEGVLGSADVGGSLGSLSG